MPRLTIYVPDALAHKLNEAQRDTPINVSAVCRRALISELAERDDMESDTVFLLARIEADVAAVRAQIVTEALEADLVAR